MYQIEFLPAADSDVDEGYQWYRKCEVRAAIDFLLAVDDAAQRVRQDPTLGPRIDEEHRFYRLKRFPYYLVYRIEPTKIVVVAVSHYRRDPAYWHGRR
jgi:plasmid stabilization system protein ParE